MQDALGLKKMTAFMADNDLESGTDGESNSWDKRIPKANAVDVFGARADHEFPAGFVSGEKTVENGSAPVGFRIALRHPDWIEGIVSQNGNAYEEGFTGVWDALRTALWKNRTPETEAPLANFFTPDGVKWIYSEGTRNPETISPDNWSTDLFFLSRPDNHRIQVDLFYDYRTNVAQYPRWHEYLRKYQPPTLLVWGANDPIFTQEGGRAFQRDVKDAELHMLDTGHFALEITATKSRCSCGLSTTARCVERRLPECVEMNAARSTVSIVASRIGRVTDNGDPRNLAVSGQVHGGGAIEDR